MVKLETNVLRQIEKIYVNKSWSNEIKVLFLELLHSLSYSFKNDLINFFNAIIWSVILSQNRKIKIIRVK